MNNLFFSRKIKNADENDFSNRAQNYYPEVLNVPENAAPQNDAPFDINDLSQFQQDFSYLQNPANQENGSQNEEKMQKKAEIFENSAENSNFSNISKEKLNYFDKNSNFSSNKNIFSAQNTEQKNEFQKNGQKNGINIENIMNFLKNGSQSDFLSSMLASGIFKNQNPAMVETLSKMLSQKNTPKPQKHNSSPDNTYFEEM